MAHKMLHEITIRVKMLRHLAQSFFQEEKEKEQVLLAKAKSDSSITSPGRRGSYRRCLRAGARIVNESRETGNSVWGKGMKAREAMWLRGAEKLSWKLSERQFKRVKAYSPACKVHVYAVDASAPTMDTSDAVGWFVVDMRDLPGQRQHEHWVKLQGASPAEVLISADLTMVQERNGPKKGSARTSWDQSSRENVEEGENAVYESKPVEIHCEGDVKLTTESDGESELEIKPETEAEVEAESKGETEAESKSGTEETHTPRVEAIPEQEDVELFITPEAEVVSELDALPVGDGADGADARVFSLSITVKGASRLSALAPHIDDSNGAGLWFSYSIFGVVLQTDRFEHLAAQPKGDELRADEPVLEPMLDSFRLRATLPGLCAFLGEAPPLQVYLCTTGRILAHADVDMSLLLPTPEWEGRDTSEFGRSGMEGDFVLRLPGEPVVLGVTGRDDAVVTVCAELTRASVGGQNETNNSLTGEVMAKQQSRGNGREKPTVVTWAQLASEPQRRLVAVKATLGRLELAPLPDLSLDGVLIGIRSPQATSTLSKEDFCLVACDSDGGVKTEDSDTLKAINWEWEGDLYEQRGNGLAEVHVVGPGQGVVEIATGIIPWPSDMCNGQQFVDVALWSSVGTKVGSCRVCLVTDGRGADSDGGADAGMVQGGPSTSVTFAEEESKLEDSQEVGQGREEVKCQAPLKAMNEGEGQVGEASQEREQDETWGRVTRSYRLSINLASVKDFENAANVVACYHYPHFGTSAPVRTSLAWVAPRMDTPFSNSCCTFSFGMSFDRLASTVRDHKLVVSIRNRDRLREEEVGLTTVPLEELVTSKPQYFRCRNTNKTFTSMSGFKASLKARQRSGGFSAEEASLLPPVEVKVLDSYLTVFSTIVYPTSSSFPSGGPPHPPSKLCSLRVSLLLEDMGPTEHPQDVVTGTISQPKKSPDGVPNAQSTGVRTTGLGNVGVMLPVVEELRNGMVEGGQDLERVWRKWEQWRVAEEASFAQRLREKDRALEAKWEARENVRRRDLAQAQTDYGKLEAKLRKALSEIEARERVLKAKEESWKSEHAQKLSELGLQQRRLREEARHQVVLERMKTKSLEKQLASQTKQLEDARGRVASAEEDLERFKEKQRKTSEGSLRQELLLLGAAKAEAESQVERERSLKMKAMLEKEEYRAHIHKLARALKRHQERESTCARREMEQLRLEYLAREERFMLDGDRNELRNMKQELDELRHLGLVQEAQASLAKTNNGNIPAASTGTSNIRASCERGGNGVRADEGVHSDVEAFFVPEPSPLPPPQPTPAPAQLHLRLDRSSVSRRSGSDSTYVSNKIPGVSGVASGGGQGEGQVEGLMEWRDCLLGTGIYTEQNPIVSELNRWIGAGGGQGECLREK